VAPCSLEMERAAAGAANVLLGGARGGFVLLGQVRAARGPARGGRGGRGGGVTRGRVGGVGGTFRAVGRGVQARCDAAAAALRGRGRQDARGGRAGDRRRVPVRLAPSAARRPPPPPTFSPTARPTVCPLLRGFRLDSGGTRCGGTTRRKADPNHAALAGRDRSSLRTAARRSSSLVPDSSSARRAAACSSASRVASHAAPSRRFCAARSITARQSVAASRFRPCASWISAAQPSLRRARRRQRPPRPPRPPAAAPAASDTHGREGGGGAGGCGGAGAGAGAGRRGRAGRDVVSSGRVCQPARRDSSATIWR